MNGAVVDLIPANVKAAKAFLEKNRKGADRIMEHLQNAAPRPLSPRYLEVSDIEVTLAQDVYSGKDAEGGRQEGVRGDRRAAVTDNRGARPGTRGGAAMQRRRARRNRTGP